MISGREVWWSLSWNGRFCYICREFTITRADRQAERSGWVKKHRALLMILPIRLCAKEDLSSREAAIKRIKHEKTDWHPNHSGSAMEVAWSCAVSFPAAKLLFVSICSLIFFGKNLCRWGSIWLQEDLDVAAVGSSDGLKSSLTCWRNSQFEISWSSQKREFLLTDQWNRLLLDREVHSSNTFDRALLNLIWLESLFPKQNLILNRNVQSDRLLTRQYVIGHCD